MSSIPYHVEHWDPTNKGWEQIGDAWITRNVFDLAPGDSLAGVFVAHNDPETGDECKHSCGGLRAHTLVSVEPLTIRASLACSICRWHGWITNGKWVPA